MENFDANKLKMIGGRVPAEFAEKFVNYCKEHGINQRILFYNLTKWWFEQDEIIQWHIYRGKVQEALSQISDGTNQDRLAAERLEEDANFEEIDHVTSLAESRGIARRTLQREKRRAKKAQPIFRKLKSNRPLSRQDKVNIRTLLSDCEDLLRTKSVAQSKDSPKGA